MASNSETGHAVNISNFKKMIDYCTEFGAQYNPSNAALTVANMTAKWTASGAAHGALTLALQQSKQPINERQLLFEPLSKLVTRVVNILMSTSASAQVKADAKGLADRIRGFRDRTKPQPDGNPDPNTVSNSQMSYVQRADAFKQLIDLLGTVVDYAPNEVELQVAGLLAKYTAMKTANDEIGTIIAPVDIKRVERNEALYAEGTGIYDVQKACKSYVKGAFGASNPRAKLIAGLKFTKPRG